jgi:nucleotide-binding universal stress UspA family protein
VIERVLLAVDDSPDSLAAARLAVETDLLTGDVGPAVLDAARAWSADLVIVGRAGRRKSGEPYVGAQTRHVLESAEQPVLVVGSGRR